MKSIQPPRDAHDGSRLKALVAANPVLGPAARAIARTPVVEGLRRRFGFRGSSSYWEKRYQRAAPPVSAPTAVSQNSRPKF
jgi:hypothetical protein